MKQISKKLRNTKHMTRTLDVPNWNQGFSSGKEESFGGKCKIQNRWENVSYVVMEGPYLDLPVYKVILRECGDKPRVLDCSLFLPIPSVQQSKPELYQEESPMEWEDTLHKGSAAHTEHDDVTDDKSVALHGMEMLQMV